MIDISVVIGAVSARSVTAIPNGPAAAHKTPKELFDGIDATEQQISALLGEMKKKI